jgi:hypothetical protein
MTQSDCAGAKLAIFAADLHECRGAGIRHRVQQHGLDSGEDDGGGADTQDNRETGNQGRNGGSLENAKGEPDVLQDRYLLTFYAVRDSEREQLT